jgi:hypothetical protein
MLLKLLLVGLERAKPFILLILISLKYFFSNIFPLLKFKNLPVGKELEICPLYSGGKTDAHREMSTQVLTLL